MKEIFLGFRSRKITNTSVAFLGVIILIYSFPIYKDNVQPGLDSSWRFAINYFFCKFKWGSEVNFTYGPLGFLGYYQDMGNNVAIAYIFWMVLFCLNIISISYLIQKNQKQGSAYKFLLATILFLLSTSVLYQPEYYLIYIAILYASIAWFANKKTLPWLILNVVFCISFYFKFSAAIIIGSILFFMMISFVLDRQESLKFIVIFVISCLTLLISLVIYSGSIQNAFTYIRASLELSSGYNTAMSLPHYDTLTPLAVCMIILYLFLAIVLLLINKNIGLYLMTFIGSIFFAFKHGFARADSGHVFLYFSYAFLLISLQLMFIDFNEIKKVLNNSKGFSNYKNIILVAAPFLIIMCLLFELTSITNLKTLTYNYIITKPKSIVTYFEKPVAIKSESSILDSRIINEIGSETVTIIPLAISYAAYNDLNYVPAPIFQTYSAYTPYLDRMNAEFFLSGDAPRYILLQFDSIDGRHPFIDIPKTWAVIENNYKAIMIYNGVALLEKTQDKYAMGDDIYEEQIIGKSQNLAVPNSEDLIIAEIDMNLSLWGNLVKFFYKIPEVEMSFIGDKGLLYKYRIVPENLRNGLIVNNIPVGIIDALFMVNTGDSYQSVEKVQLSGPGLKYYKDEVKVKFRQLISKGKFQPEIQGDYLSEEVKNINTDKIIEAASGSVDIVRNSDLYPGFIQINGWGNVSGESSDNQKVYLEIQSASDHTKHYYLARQTIRPDVSQHYNSPDFYKSGYEFQIDPLNIANGEKYYGRVIVESKGRYYTIGEIQELELEENIKEYSEEVASIQYIYSAQLKGNIDEVEMNNFDINKEIKIEGWAFLDKEDVSTQDILLLIRDDRGNQKIYRTSKMERPDVSQFFGNYNLNKTGFSCMIDYSTFEGVPNQINILVTNGQQYFKLDKDFGIR